MKYRDIYTAKYLNNEKKTIFEIMNKAWFSRANCKPCFVLIILQYWHP